jgi:hypothetical protein
MKAKTRVWLSCLSAFVITSMWQYALADCKDPNPSAGVTVYPLLPIPAVGQTIEINYENRSSLPLRLEIFSDPTRTDPTNISPTSKYIGQWVANVSPGEIKSVKWNGGQLSYTFETCSSGYWTSSGIGAWPPYPGIDIKNVPGGMSFILRPADTGNSRATASEVTVGWGNGTKAIFMKTNQFLGLGDYLTSGNKQYFAVMQGDGNLVVYRGSDPNNNHGFVWGSVQVGRYAPSAGTYFAVMQGDGNLVVYRGSDPSDNHGFVWGSVQDGGYAPSAGSYFAVMQDDGNLVVYRGSDPNNNQGFVWGSTQSLATANQQHPGCQRHCHWVPIPCGTCTSPSCITTGQTCGFQQQCTC